MRFGGRKEFALENRCRRRSLRLLVLRHALEDHLRAFRQSNIVGLHVLVVPRRAVQIRERAPVPVITVGLSERRDRGERDVEEGAHGEHVGLFGVYRAPISAPQIVLLRRPVRRRSQPRVSAFQALRGRSEIEKLDVEVLVEEALLEFEIAMRYFLTVYVLQSRKKLGRDDRGRLDAQLLSFLTERHQKVDHRSVRTVIRNENRGNLHNAASLALMHGILDILLEVNGVDEMRMLA